MTDSRRIQPWFSPNPSPIQSAMATAIAWPTTNRQPRSILWRTPKQRVQRWLPTKSFQVDAALVKQYALILQPGPLDSSRVAAGRQGNAALSIDDPVPGHIRSFRQMPQSLPHQPRPRV